MANEVTVNATLAYQDADMSSADTMQIVNFLYSIGAKGLLHTKQQVTTSAAALNLGPIATLGYCFLKNLDPTNVIKVLNATGGKHFATLQPNGGVALFYAGADVTAPFVQSVNASCWMEYLIANA